MKRKARAIGNNAHQAANAWAYYKKGPVLQPTPLRSCGPLTTPPHGARPLQATMVTSVSQNRYRMPVKTLNAFAWANWTSARRYALTQTWPCVNADPVESAATRETSIVKPVRMPIMS